MIHINPKGDVQVVAGTTELEVIPREPYSPLVLDFLDELSRRLKKHARDYPDLAALAFWCRKGNLTQLKNNFNEPNLRMGRGLAFHIAPSNVPINFSFSYIFGLLSGNSNIVRLPSRNFPQVNVICDEFRELFLLQKFKELFRSSALIRYEPKDEVTTRFSEECDARVIWGGDQTVNHIRSLPSQSQTVDIAFADRYSICLINASEVIQLEDSKLEVLAEGFYNDTYLMDQNACSSPHLVIWIGDSVRLAQKVFWTAVSKVVDKKYRMEPIQNIDKYTQLCLNLVNGPDGQKASLDSPFLYRVEAPQLTSQTQLLRGGFGLFYEHSVQSFQGSGTLKEIVNKKFQTVTYFGLDPKEIGNKVLAGHLMGVDRIVPIGKALDIGIYWDGFDVVRSLSRVVFVQ